MNILNDKCPICGGRLKIVETNRVCDACGEKIPDNSSDPFVTEYIIANNERQCARFNEAQKIYQGIINKNQDKDIDLSDIYWGLFLCEQNVIFEYHYFKNKESFPCFYGINTIDPEKSEYYLMAVNDALKYSSYYDYNKVEVFKKLAALIRDTKNKFIDIYSKEEAFEVFICFKNKDNGKYTPDREQAYKLYKTLTDMGYKVFMSEESLKNIKSDYRQYEPNIFHALYTSKIMFLICSDVNYINSHNLKNEWERFLHIHNSKNVVPVIINNFDPLNLPLGIIDNQVIDKSKKDFIQQIKNCVVNVLGQRKNVDENTDLNNQKNQKINIKNKKQRVNTNVSDSNNSSKTTQKFNKSERLKKKKKKRFSIWLTLLILSFALSFFSINYPGNIWLKVISNLSFTSIFFIITLLIEGDNSSYRRFGFIHTLILYICGFIFTGIIIITSKLINSDIMFVIYLVYMSMFILGMCIRYNNYNAVILDYKGLYTNIFATLIISIVYGFICGFNNVICIVMLGVSYLYLLVGIFIILKDLKYLIWLSFGFTFLPAILSIILSCYYPVESYTAICVLNMCSVIAFILHFTGLVTEYFELSDAWNNVAIVITYIACIVIYYVMYLLLGDGSLWHIIFMIILSILSLLPWLLIKLFESGLYVFLGLLMSVALLISFFIGGDKSYFSELTFAISAVLTIINGVGAFIIRFNDYI